ncbi:MAG: hypothetical protein GC153_13305 [Alphaproteobacteria bacterium]|nr:hypothetical protein [Alphaproteobacteria bacterium]
MSATTGIIAGIAAAAGALAVYRLAMRRAQALKTALAEARRPRGDRVIDFERDPATGVFRAK